MLIFMYVEMNYDEINFNVENDINYIIFDAEQF